MQTYLIAWKHTTEKTYSFLASCNIDFNVKFIAVFSSFCFVFVFTKAKDTKVLVATEQPKMLDRLQEANILLEDIQKGLNIYLESKRLFFPR